MIVDRQKHLYVLGGVSLTDSDFAQAVKGTTGHKSYRHIIRRQPTDDETMQQAALCGYAPRPDFDQPGWRWALAFSMNGWGTPDECASCWSEYRRLTAALLEVEA